MEYPDELADLLRERFGPKKDRNQPTRFTAAVYMTCAMAGLLSEEDFAVFLQSALRADSAGQGPDANWPFPRSFTDRFARELRTHLGPLEEAEGRMEAWHIMFALHGILAPDLVGPFIRCAHDAWENTVELTQRVPAARA
ncbi:hypothetical protein ACGFZ9_39735 [Streptomyces mirabilis]|uniref:hypothetical protein n=1 Tax=Streptomyces mirabilis TaxID=68239 RepID=UPI003720BB81